MSPNLLYVKFAKQLRLALDIYYSWERPKILLGITTLFKLASCGLPPQWFKELYLFNTNAASHGKPLFLEEIIKITPCHCLLNARSRGPHLTPNRAAIYELASCGVASWTLCSISAGLQQQVFWETLNLHDGLAAVSAGHVPLIPFPVFLLLFFTTRQWYSMLISTSIGFTPLFSFIYCTISLWRYRL